jgi:putative endonuclease
VAQAPHLEVGRWAETEAARHLGARGLRLLTRNFRCRHGEIDLIMRDRAQIVFVEVRYRADDRFGDGFDTMTRSKRRRLLTAARWYLASRGAEHVPCRFDVVSVSKRNYRPEIHWMQDAFTQDD